MYIRTNASFSLKHLEQIKKELGINTGGRVQKVVDVTVMHYLKLLMPRDVGVMQSQTKNVHPGLILVDTPYAHYMNEGILYVMPENNKGAFHNPISGMYWSKKGVKKVPSATPLNYRGGPNRGSHFVERTLEGHFNDILRVAKREVRK